MKATSIFKKGENIYDYYNIEKDKQPLILIGENAEKLYIKYLTGKGMLPRDAYKKTKRTNGAFLYQSLDIDYIKEHFSDYMKANEFAENAYENGVICMLRNKIPTLAHEIRHAYQLQNDELNEYMMIENNRNLTILYSRYYIFYPNEQDAFNSALEYLKSNESKLEYLKYLGHILSLELEYAFKLKSTLFFKTGITMNKIKKLFRLKNVDLKPINVKYFIR